MLKDFFISCCWLSCLAVCYGEPKILSAAGPPFACRSPGYSSPGVEPTNDDSDQTR